MITVKLKYLKNHWKMIIYIFHTLYFNFKFLPFKQALKLPVILYKPKFMGLSGKIMIEGPVSPGMITMGFNRVPFYPNEGIKFDNSGIIIFKGACNIGNGSAISVGKKATLTFGSNFKATCSFKCISHNHIYFGSNCLIGWDCLFMDTDWHRLKYLDNRYTKGYGSIKIGNDVWFANGCKIYKNTIVPNRTTLSANTILSEKLDIPENCIIGNFNEIKIRRQGLWHKMGDDKVIYRE